MWSISESSVVSPLIEPTLRDSTNHGTSCFCVLETLPFSLPADIFYSTPTLLTSEVTRSCSCGLSLTIGHILMRFGRMGLSNATQTVVPAPTRPHLLMASSPLRMYHQEGGCHATRKYEGYAAKPASSMCAPRHALSVSSQPTGHHHQGLPVLNRGGGGSSAPPFRW
jgi:hypothetical protein